MTDWKKADVLRDAIRLQAEVADGREGVQRVLRVADEVWIATALLHRDHPARPDFTVGEIVKRVEREGLTGSLRKGVYVHAALHCVANLAPNPGRYRMLVETGTQRRRLFRPGDPYHPARAGSKTRPSADGVPVAYRMLLTWHDEWARQEGSDKDDPLLALRGTGRELWKDEDPDDYVRRVREGWD